VGVLTALSAVLSANAADYYVVVPLKGKTANEQQSQIKVTLAENQLPAAKVGQVYPGFDFKSLLRVTGDAGFTGTGVSWSVAGGSLPAGLTLTEDGKLTGTPLSAGTSTILVRATYKSKTGETAFQLISVGLAVELRAAPNGALRTQPFYALSAPLLGYVYVDGVQRYPWIDADRDNSVDGFTWQLVASNLPPGLTLTSKGYIEGSARATGTGSVTARVTYQGVSSEQTYIVVSSSLEDDVPNTGSQGFGDGNGDGVLDSSQQNVMSFKLSAIAGTPFTTLAVASAYRIVIASSESTPAGLPRGAKMPFGRVRFKVDQIPQGGTIALSLYVPSNLAGTGFWVPTAAGVQSNIATLSTVDSKQRIDFSLTDGGPYDLDGQVNGSITL
jgi:hypothetical protein